MSEEVKRYVCSISVMRKSGMLVAGTPFVEADLTKVQFEQLTEQGYIKPWGAVVSPPVPGMRSLVNREGEQTEAIKEQKPQKPQADALWNVNPDLIKDLPFEVLMSSYQEVCEKNGIVPAKFTQKDEVIAQLSAQFVKS
jgi:hypothetical protein